MQTRFDAIIIGAGPSGSTAAILLAQAGWSVALIEKQPFPRRKVCGECIAASNLPLLDKLGIGAAFSVVAGPQLQHVALWCGARAVTAALPAAAGAHPWGRALGREHLDALLLQRAHAVGATVLQPCTALSLSGQAGDFRCDILCADQEEAVTLRAPVAIAAHGSWESLPSERARGRTERRGSDLLAFKANFVNVCLQPGVLPVISFRGGYGGMVVADHGITTLACCIRVDRLRACRQAASDSAAGAAVEATLRQECAGVRQALAGAVVAERWLAAGPLRPGVRLSREGTGAFLIGNAAGEAHPIIGEGISMAIQSAWLLCAQLIPRRDVLHPGIHAQRPQRETQRRYALEWHRHFRPRIRLAAWFAHAAMRPAVMSSLMPLVHRTRHVLTHGARWSGKVRSAPDPAAIATLAAMSRGPHSQPAPSCLAEPYPEHRP